jgi:hypothetical protein
MVSPLRFRCLLLACLACTFLAVPAPACPFCTMQGKTLTGEVEQASMVLYGKLTNPNLEKETTDLVIEAVIKDHKFRAGRTRLTLKRYVDPETAQKDRFLIFCDIFKDNLDPYRGVPVKKDSNLPAYLKGALKVQGQPIGKRLRFFFNYLDSPDLEISNDAYKEFANADYKDYKDMAHDLPAARIVKWLKDPDTPAFRTGLYASMLGHCGKARDAAVLRELLDDPDRRTGSGVDGLLAGYVMLKPGEGWKYTRGLLKNTREEFSVRYAALRALRFLHDFRPDLVARKELADAACLLLDQDDISDLAIEDLRKWRAWDKVDRVLAVQKTEAYRKQPIIQRAVLRFCLACKGSPAAAEFVAARRKADPDAVKDAEELLQLESEEAAPAGGASAAKEKK